MTKYGRSERRGCLHAEQLWEHSCLHVNVHHIVNKAETCTASGRSSHDVSFLACCFGSFLATTPSLSKEMNASFSLSHCLALFFFGTFHAAVWWQRLLSFTCSIVKNENARQRQVEASDLLHTLVQRPYTRARGANCSKCQKKKAAKPPYCC